MKTALIVLAHGSKRNETKETLADIVHLIKEQANYDVVEEAFLQFNEPTLQDAVDKLAAQAVTRVVVAPYFLFKGVHNTEDIPNELALMKEKYSHMEFRFAEPLGVDERLAQILIERAQEVANWNI